jgi:hypothetical protein
VSAAVDAEAARRLPGTGGDAAMAAQDLPGVARAAPGATGLVIWGAAPAESRVLFDGVEIPALTHFGGFRSTVGAELVRRINVVPGAYGAEYGRALGGLVRIEPRPLETSGSHLVLDANLLDGGASFRGGVGRLASPPPHARAISIGPTAARCRRRRWIRRRRNRCFPSHATPTRSSRRRCRSVNAPRCARSRWRRPIACAARATPTPRAATFSR